MMYVECTPQLCPCNDQCSNQRIAKHEWSPGLQRFMTRDRGWGIRTTEFIRNGKLFFENSFFCLNTFLHFSKMFLINKFSITLK